MFKYFKFLVPVFLVNSSVFASSGFFVGGSVNLQQNAYSKSGANTNASLVRKISALTSQQIKDLKVQMAEIKAQINLLNDKINDLSSQLPGTISIDNLSPEFLENLSNTQSIIWGKINENKEKREKLYAQLKEIEQSIKESNQEEEAAILEENQLIALSKEEINKIKSSDSKIEPSISLLAGYSVKNGNFGFITEAGVDLNFSKVGNSDDRRLEVKNIYNLYLTQKAGYYLHREMLAYVTAGLSIKDTKVNYNRDNNLIQINIEEKKILPNLILGLGFERVLNKNLSMFGEFNHIFSLTSVKTIAGDVKTRSEQVRIGARYYL